MGVRSMHIALIPDGNRRFMEKRGIGNLLDSYQMGIQRFYDFLEWCVDLGVSEVTIYALSTENITNRTREEIEILLRVFLEEITKAIHDRRLDENGIGIKVCGDLNYLNNGVANPQLARKLLSNLMTLEEKTKNYNKLRVNLAIAYGGRQEIIHAANFVVKEGLPLTEENLRRYLWIPNYPDIIIRTAEERLSNFLLWQSAYAEIYFVPKLWQEFTREDLEAIINDYNHRERRFGR